MLDKHFLYPCAGKSFIIQPHEKIPSFPLINLKLRENASLLSLSHLHKETFQSSITFKNKFMWHLNEVKTEAR